jgi:mercuric ion transport protein
LPLALPSFSYRARMTSKSLLWTGITGAVLAVLCCATPLLVLLLAAVGLSALTGYLDYVLLPAIAIFIGMTIYAVWRRQPA